MGEENMVAIPARRGPWARSYGFLAFVFLSVLPLHCYANNVRLPPAKNFDLAEWVGNKKVMADSRADNLEKRVSDGGGLVNINEIRAAGAELKELYKDYADPFSQLIGESCDARIEGFRVLQTHQVKNAREREKLYQALVRAHQFYDDAQVKEIVCDASPGEIEKITIFEGFLRSKLDELSKEIGQARDQCEFPCRANKN